MHPRDFSSIVVMPPRILPGVGCEPLISTPARRALSSTLSTIPYIFRATPLLIARAARRCSAPIISDVSERITVPPNSTSRSETSPTAGFAVRPELKSDPPHSVAMINSETGQERRSSRASAFCICLTTSAPRLTLPRSPPQSWISSASASFPLVAISSANAGVSTCSHPSPTTSTAPTLGLFAKPTRVLLNCSKSAPSNPQPKGWTPTTVDGILRLIRLATSLAQTTVESIST